MVKSSINNAKYTYVHDQKYPPEAVDIHHVIVRKSGAKHLFVYILALLVLACAFYLYMLKKKSINFVYYGMLFDILLINLLLWKPVEKGEDLINWAYDALIGYLFFFWSPESVVIIPAFGVQLETYYMSGKVNRCFVPIDKILKPVLVECVTPMTCYWTLSLIIHGESELMLVFKNLRPPVKMLIPIWKALCTASGSQEGSDTCTVDT